MLKFKKLTDDEILALLEADSDVDEEAIDEQEIVFDVSQVHYKDIEQVEHEAETDNVEEECYEFELPVITSAEIESMNVSIFEINSENNPVTFDAHKAGPSNVTTKPPDPSDPLLSTCTPKKNIRWRKVRL